VKAISTRWANTLSDVIAIYDGYICVSSHEFTSDMSFPALGPPYKYIHRYKLYYDIHVRDKLYVNGTEFVLGRHVGNTK
jgi:hypothetical protein